jgi:hypothetical protein
MPFSSRAAVVTLVLVVLGGVLLAIAPYGLPAIRLAGISLLWWYAGFVGPVVAAAITVVALLLSAGR